MTHPNPPPWARQLTEEQLQQTIATTQQYCGEDIADWSEDLSDSVEVALVHTLATLRAAEAERDRLLAALQRLVSTQDADCMYERGEQPVICQGPWVDGDICPWCQARAALAPETEAEA